MLPPYPTSFCRIRLFLWEVYGVAKAVWPVGTVAATYCASYWWFYKSPATFFRLQFHPRTDDRYCVLCQYLSSVLRFSGLHWGYGSSLFLQGGLLYSGKQSSSCGYPVWRATRKLIHPISLAVRFGQRAVPAIQGRHTVHYSFQSFIGTFRCQEQQDIGHLRNKKSHQGTENIEQEFLAKWKSTVFGQTLICKKNTAEA